MAPSPSSRGPSNTQVDRAGDLLRDWALRDGEIQELDHDPALNKAVDTLIDFRFKHAVPQAVVGLTVRRVIQDAVPAAEPPIGRRKRAGAILWKLVRFPTMRLSQMEDVGGWRAKLPSQSDVNAVLAELRRQWPDARLIDYVARPKLNGYRAKHLIVQVEGCRIEIQLRTPLQNLWADEVEKAADRLHQPLKDGKGPSDLVRYFEVAAADAGGTGRGTGTR